MDELFCFGIWRKRRQPISLGSWFVEVQVQWQEHCYMTCAEKLPYCREINGLQTIKTFIESWKREGWGLACARRLRWSFRVPGEEMAGMGKFCLFRVMPRCKRSVWLGRKETGEIGTRFHLSSCHGGSRTSKYTGIWLGTGQEQECLQLTFLNRTRLWHICYILIAYTCSGGGGLAQKKMQYKGSDCNCEIGMTCMMCDELYNISVHRHWLGKR